MARERGADPETAQSQDETLFKESRAAIAALLLNRQMFKFALSEAGFHVRRYKWGCFIIETFLRSVSGDRKFINWVCFTHYANRPIAFAGKFPICEYKSELAVIIREYCRSGLKHFRLQ